MHNLDRVATLYQAHFNFGLSRLFRSSGVGIEVSGSGNHVLDHTGREFLDFCTSFGVFNLGYANERVAQGLVEQLNTLPLLPTGTMCPSRAALEERLAQVVPSELDRQYYSGSGSEGIEIALRIAHDHVSDGRDRLVAVDKGYHGKTLGALGVIGQEHLRAPFEPLFDNVVHTRSADTDSIVSAINERCAAVIVEPVVAGNFLHVPPPGYLRAIRDRCDQTGAIMIVDEVQTAFGRTGELMGIDRDGVVPDILVASKALTGGHLPIAITFVRSDCFAGLNGGNESDVTINSMMSGGPLVCSVALAAIDETIERDLPGNARRMGERLLSGLRSLADRYPNLIKRADGLGLMTGIEVTGRAVEFALFLKMFRRSILIGLSLNTGSRTPVVRFYPPLAIDSDTIDHVLHELETSLKEIDKLPARVLDAIHYATRYAPYFPAPLAKIARQILG